LLVMSSFVAACSRDAMSPSGSIPVVTPGGFAEIRYDRDRNERPTRRTGVRPTRRHSRSRGRMAIRQSLRCERLRSRIGNGSRRWRCTRDCPGWQRHRYGNGRGAVNGATLHLARRRPRHARRLNSAHGVGDHGIRYRGECAERSMGEPDPAIATVGNGVMRTRSPKGR
jgi:hypothetical protein